MGSLGYAPPMFCQSCGAKNSPDARFCNQCGTRIAQKGEPGGPMETRTGMPAQDVAASPPKEGPKNAPVGMGQPESAQPESAPPARAPVSYGGSLDNASMMSVSLAGIGVRSSKKTWGIIVLIAVALVAAGAVGSWLLRGEPEQVASDEGHAEPDDPFVIGSPEIPMGEEPPEVDAVSGMVGEGASMSSMSAMSTMSTMSSAMRSTMSSSAGSSSGGSTSMSSTSSGTASMGSTSTTMTGAAMTEAGSDSTSMTGAGSGSGSTSMETSMESTSMTSLPPMGSEEMPEERDLEMEMYSSRVRYVISRYYAGRARSCFDRATRNNPTLSGTVVINMTIAASDGSVPRASVARNSTGDEVLGRCLAAQVTSWRLPPPPGGENLQMQMPFSR